MMEFKNKCTEISKLITTNPALIGLSLFLFLTIAICLRNCGEVKKDFEVPKSKIVIETNFKKQQKNVKTKSDSMATIINNMSISEKRIRAAEIYAKRHPKL
jgi:hypothetical protein